MNAYGVEDLTLGHSETFSVTLTQQMMDQFLALSGDNNPLHVDKSYAQLHHFKDCVCYGLLVSSFYSTLAGVYLPGKRCLLHSVNVSFLKPAFVGDQLTICGEVAHINKSYGQIEIKGHITNQAGEKLSRALIKAGFLG